MWVGGWKVPGLMWRLRWISNRGLDASFVTFEDIMSGAVAIFVWIAIKINCCCGSNKLFPITLSKVVCSYSSVRTISSGQSQPLNIILRKALIWKHSTRFPQRNCVSNAFPHGLSRGHSFPHGNAVREEAGKKIQITEPRFPSIPRGLSNVGTTCFVDFQVVTGQCLLKIISWKCE